MIIAYRNNEISGWVEYVDFLAAKGKRLFVTERFRKEFTGDLPAQFHIYKSQEADIRAQRAYPVVMNRFGVNTTKFATDLHWLLEAGQCMCICEDIPLLAIGNPGNVFALTSNASLIRRFIKTPEGRSKLEKIVDEQGLDHLADIRGVHFDGSFEDYYSMD